MELVYDFSENEFVQSCTDRIVNSDATIFEGVFSTLSHFLRSPKNERGEIQEIRNKDEYEYYDKGLSLPDYIQRGFLEIYYSSLDVYSEKETPLTIDSVHLPSFLRLEPISYGGGVRKTIKVKQHNLKTKNRISVKFLHLVLNGSTLEKIQLEARLHSTRLLPSKLGVWEWRQTFYDKITGACYFCSCFRGAIELDGDSRIDHPHLESALNSDAYKDNICHMCSGANSDLFYCHPMYASAFKVKYGAYIKKTEIEEGIDETEAENKIRESKGVARIGERWVNETLLFNYINLLFPQYTVQREASPAWLGNQRIDIFVPEINLAVEYQGQQHFQAVELFGGKAGLEATKQRDKNKALKCKNNGIDLVYFTYKDNLSEKLVNRRLKKYMAEEQRENYT